MVTVFLTETCNGCGGPNNAICVKSCPAAILEVRKDHPSDPKARGIVHVLNDKACLECYACERLCPTKSIFINPPDFKIDPILPQLYDINENSGIILKEH